MDGFARLEGEAPSGDRHDLVPQAFQTHFNPALFVVPDRPMTEALDVEQTLKLPVDLGEQVQVKSCGDALGVVIGRL